MLPSAEIVTRAHHHNDELVDVDGASATTVRVDDNVVFGALAAPTTSGLLTSAGITSAVRKLWTVRSNPKVASSDPSLGHNDDDRGEAATTAITAVTAITVPITTGTRTATAATAAVAVRGSEFTGFIAEVFVGGSDFEHELESAAELDEQQQHDGITGRHRRQSATFELVEKVTVSTAEAHTGTGLVLQSCLDGGVVETTGP